MCNNMIQACDDLKTYLDGLNAGSGDMVSYTTALVIAGKLTVI